MKTLKIKTAKKEAKPLLTSVTNIHNEVDPRVGMVKIFHSQGIKQSKSYQTGDVNYGVELYVRNDPSEIKKGIQQAEQIVEDALGDKLPMMNEILSTLADNNRS